MAVVLDDGRILLERQCSMDSNHIIDWKDPKLEAQIRSILGISGPITIQDVRKLDELDLMSGDLVSNASALSDFTWLKKLSIGIDWETSISFLECMPELEELSLSSVGKLDISPIKKLKNLRLLSICGDPLADVNPINLSVLGELKHLTYLKLMSMSSVDFSFLEKLTNLEQLELVEIGPMRNTRSITASPKLKELTLFDLILNDVDFLFRLKHRLQYLDVSSNVIFNSRGFSVLDQIVTNDHYEVSSNEMDSLETLESYNNGDCVSDNCLMDEETFNWFMNGRLKEYWDLAHQKN